MAQTHNSDDDNISLTDQSENHNVASYLFGTEHGWAQVDQFLFENKDDILIKLIEIGAKLPINYTLQALSSIPKKDQTSSHPE